MVVLCKIEGDVTRYLFIHSYDAPECLRKEALEILIDEHGLKLVRPWGELYVPPCSLKSSGFVEIIPHAVIEELKKFLVEILENL